MSRRRLVGAGIAVAAAAVVAVVVLGSRGDDGGGGRPPATVPLEPPVAVQAERDEALALIRRARDLTYHARYEASAGGAGALPRSVEVWRRSGTSRTDTEYAADGAVERSAVVRRPGGAAVTCRKTGDAPWACESTEAAPEDLFEQAAADLADTPLAARDSQVRGRPARCFTIQAEDVLELCFDEEGVLLRMAAGDAALELVAKDPMVDAAAVEPPASTPPSPPTT